MMEARFANLPGYRVISWLFMKIKTGIFQLKNSCFYICAPGGERF